MGLEAGVVDGVNARRFLEKAGDTHGVFVMGAHPVRQGLDAAYEHPAVVRSGNCTSKLLNLSYLREYRGPFAGDNGSGEDVTVSAEVLRRGVHYKIRTAEQRLLIHRAGPGVVYTYRAVQGIITRGKSGGRADCRDIGDVQHGVGGSLYPYERNTFRAGAFDVGSGPHVDGHDLDAPSCCYLREVASSSVIEVLRYQNPIAGFEGLEHGCRRSHPGTEGRTEVPHLQLCEHPFEVLPVRVVHACVLEVCPGMLVVVPEYGASDFRGNDWRACVRVATVAPVNRDGFGAHAVFWSVGHRCISGSGLYAVMYTFPDGLSHGAVGSIAFI